MFTAWISHVDLLVGAGLPVYESDLFTSLSAARSYIAGRSDLRPLLLMEEEAQQGTPNF
jgi:hypothetical protein